MRKHLQLIMVLLGSFCLANVGGTAFAQDTTCTIVPYVQVNGGAWIETTTAEMRQGSEVWFGPQSEEFGADGGTWSWTGPEEFTSQERAPRIANIQPTQAGTYTVSNTDQNGCTATADFVIGVSEFQAVDIRVRGAGIDIENVNYKGSGDQLIYPKGIATRFESRPQYSTPGEQHLWQGPRPALVQGMDYATTPLLSEDSRGDYSIDSFMADQADTIYIALPIDTTLAGWTKTSTTFYSSITTFYIYSYNYTTPNQWVDIPYNDQDTPTILFGEQGYLKFDNPLPISPLAEGVIITDFGRDYNRGFYVVDPHLLILPNGDYIAGRNRTRFISKNRGVSWDTLQVEDYGVEHASTFYHEGALYIIGDESGLSNYESVITRSTDGGLTWSEPVKLGFEGRNSPSRVEVSQGRLWLAMEDYRSAVVKVASAPVDSDLLNPESWTFTSRPDDPVGDPNDDSEPCMTIGRDGYPIAFSLLEGPVRANSPTEATELFPSSEFQLPGRGSKFDVKYDSLTDKYWALTSYSPVEGSIRTGITLWSSTDLKNWIKERVVMQGTSPSFHGFNYPYIQFDGEDMVFVSRTSWENEWGQAQRWHDGNMLTFHRVRDFRASNTILPQVRVNEGPAEESTTAVAEVGDQVTFSPQSRELGIVEEGWSWTGPNGFTATTREIVLDDVQSNQAGTYTATFTSPTPNTVVTSLDFILGLPGNCTIIPALNINGTGWMDSVSTATVIEGDELRFGPQSAEFGASGGTHWTWTGPNDYSFTGRAPTIADIQVDQSGTYTVTFVDPTGCVATLDHVITVRTSCETPPSLYVNVDGQGWTSETSATVVQGSRVEIEARNASGDPDVAESWSWTGPNDFTATTRKIQFESAQGPQNGTYTLTQINASGCITTAEFALVVVTSPLEVGTYYFRNLSTGQYLDSEADGVVLQGSPEASETNEWRFVFSTEGYYYIDNALPDRGPLTATPSRGAITYRSESFLNSPFANREWEVVSLGENRYTFLSKDASRGYIAVVGETGVENIPDGDSAAAQWELIPIGPASPSCVIIPQASLNGESLDSASTVAAVGGDAVVLSPQSGSGTDTAEGWSWTGPNGFASTQREVILEDIQLDQAGSYEVSFTDSTGCTATLVYTVTVENSCTLLATVSLNDEVFEDVRYVVAALNNRIVFSPLAQGNTTQEEGWSWTGPRGFTATGRELVIDRAKFRDIGVYEVTLDDGAGCVTSHTFIVAVVPPPFVGRCYTQDDAGNALKKWFPSPIVVYPNPVAGPTFSIDVMGVEVTEVIITNLRGNVVYQQSVELADLPLTVDKPLKNGIYVVKVRDTQGKWYLDKLIVYDK